MEDDLKFGITTSSFKTTPETKLAPVEPEIGGAQPQPVSVSLIVKLNIVFLQICS